LAKAIWLTWTDELAAIPLLQDQFRADPARIRAGGSVSLFERDQPISRLERVPPGCAGNARLGRLKRAGIIRRGTGTIRPELLRRAVPKATRRLVEALLDERPAMAAARQGLRLVPTGRYSVAATPADRCHPGVVPGSRARRAIPPIARGPSWPRRSKSQHKMCCQGVDPRRCIGGIDRHRPFLSGCPGIAT
jgi:hypothetical protein